MEYGALYFYTSIIHQRRPLIRQYDFYNCIIDSLSFLHRKCLIRVYGFVIMPNHIHLVWQLLRKNGKKSPAASLMKFTAHEFERFLRQHHIHDLENYAVNWRSRKYNFWQPEPNWFYLGKETTTWQKINYMHQNPVYPKWQLVDDPAGYPFSSAAFYQTGKTDYEFLYHYRDFADILPGVL